MTPEQIEQLKNNSDPGNDTTIPKLCDLYLSASAMGLDNVAALLSPVPGARWVDEKECMNKLFTDYDNYFTRYVLTSTTEKPPANGNTLAYALQLPVLHENQLAQNVAKMQAGITVDHISNEPPSSPPPIKGGKKNRTRRNRPTKRASI